MTREQELQEKMTNLRNKFYNIRRGFRTLKSYNFVGRWTKKEALEMINEEFKEARDEYLALIATVSQ